MVSGQMDSTSGFGPHIGCIFLDWNGIGTIPDTTMKWSKRIHMFDGKAGKPVQVAMGLMIV
jgi:hypothetical protein